MADPAAKRATWADLEALPEHVRGELIFGVLHTHAQPTPRHQHIAGLLFARVSGPYDHDRQSPSGWWNLVEPGIGLPGLDVGEVVPDIAGWRRERLPELPDQQIQLAPDWVCEVLSPSMRTHDLRLKRKLYADAGVQWMWVVDPEARTLTASRLHTDGSARRWLELAVFADDDIARIEPFDEIELRCGELWG